MKCKFDLEKLGKIKDDINRYIDDLKEFKIRKEENLVNKETFYAISMIMFSILNRCIDLGNEIISACEFGLPITYKDIFEILYQKKVISENTKLNFFKFIYYRNLIAHQYYRINKKQLFNFVKKISIIENFLKEIYNFVNK